MIAIARLDQLSGHVADLFKRHRRILEALLIDGQTVADQIAAALVRLVVHAGVLAIGLDQAVKVFASLRTGKHILSRRQNLVIRLGGHSLQLRAGLVKRRLRSRKGFLQRRNLLVIAGLSLFIIGRRILSLEIIELTLRIADGGVGRGNRAVQIADFALLLVAETNQQVLHAAVALRHIVIRRAVILGGHITGRIRIIALLLRSYALVKLFLHLIIGHFDILSRVFANLLTLHAGRLVLHEVLAGIADGIQIIGQHLVELIVGHGRLALDFLRLSSGGLVGGCRNNARFLFLDGFQIRIVLRTDHQLIEAEHAVGVALHVGGILFRQWLKAQFLHLILKHDALNHLLDSRVAIGLHVVVGKLHGHAKVLLIILLIVTGQIIPVSFPFRLGDFGAALIGLHRRHNLRTVEFVVVADQVAAGKQHHSRKQQRNQRESLIHVRSLFLSASTRQYTTNYNELSASCQACESRQRLFRGIKPVFLLNFTKRTHFIRHIRPRRTIWTACCWATPAHPVQPESTW